MMPVKVETSFRFLLLLSGITISLENIESYEPQFDDLHDLLGKLQDTIIGRVRSLSEVNLNLGLEACHRPLTIRSLLTTHSPPSNLCLSSVSGS